MKKIILIIFSFFFISSVSYSQTKDIQIGRTLKENRIIILNCKNRGEEKDFSYITTIYKNMNPGVILYSKGEGEFDPRSLLASFLFYNKVEQNFIFYQNLEGKTLAKYSYSVDEMSNSSETGNKFSIKIIAITPLSEINNSQKLYQEWIKILPNWILSDLVSPEKSIDRSDLKKLENYSNSLRDLFEKQHNELKKNEIGKKLIQNVEFNCDQPKFFNIKT